VRLIAASTETSAKLQLYCTQRRARSSTPNDPRQRKSSCDSSAVTRKSTMATREIRQRREDGVPVRRTISRVRSRYFFPAGLAAGGGGGAAPLPAAGGGAAPLPAAGGAPFASG